MTRCDGEGRSFERLKQRLHEYDRRLTRVQRFPSGAVHYIVEFDLDVPYTYATLAGVQRHLDRISGTRAEVQKALDKLDDKPPQGLFR